MGGFEVPLYCLFVRCLNLDHLGTWKLMMIFLMDPDLKNQNHKQRFPSSKKDG